MKTNELLKERVKELRCLFRMSELVDYFEDDLERILEGIVEVVRESWQFPDITVVRIDLDGKQYSSRGYCETEWLQKAKVKFNGSPIGEVRVCYTEPREQQYEGPFLQEERLLINAVAERLGRIMERIRAKEELELGEEALRKKNIAMTEVLHQVRSESSEVKNRIQANIDYLVLPLLEKLERNLENTSYKYSVSLLKDNLLEIASPLYSELSRDFSSLTPRELQICNMITKGFKSKDISRMNNLSPSTIHRHRENIRNKLGLTNTGTNLEVFLQNYMKLPE